MKLRKWVSLFVAAWVLLPIYLIGLNALSPPDAANAWPKDFLPVDLSFATLGFFFSVDGVWAATLNSAIVAGLTVLMSLAMGLPAGYALARFRFPGKDPYRLLVVLTRAFPIAILALPLTVRFIELNIYDTVLAVALVHTALALPFAVLVGSSLFLAIPQELEEAAWTLGCSRLGAFIRVALPLALPGIAATAVFAFVVSWNEVFAATVLTLRERTLPAFLLAKLDESPLHFRFAGGFFLIVPALAFIFLVRRYLFSLWGVSNR